MSIEKQHRIEEKRKCQRAGSVSPLSVWRCGQMRQLQPHSPVFARLLRRGSERHKAAFAPKIAWCASNGRANFALSKNVKGKNRARRRVICRSRFFNVGTSE